MAVIASITIAALSPQVGAQLILISIGNAIQPIPAGLPGGVISAPVMNATPGGGSTGTSAYAVG